MSEKDRLHVIEHRQLNDRGHWGGWCFRDRFYLTYRRAKRDRDILLSGSDDRDYQCRVVTFVRGRTYE